MSLRAFGSRLFKHGTAIVRTLYKREFNTSTIAENVKPVRNVAVVPQQITARNFALRNVGVQVGLHARRLFVDSVLNRVTNSLAAELRKKAARRMLFGDSGPFFALVGVSLASGTGILTKEDELEGICLEIREAVSKMKWPTTDYFVDETTLSSSPLTLSDLELSAPIAKGCSAVVYGARLITEPLTNPYTPQTNHHTADTHATVTTASHIAAVPQEVASHGDDVVRTQQRNNHHTPDTHATVTTASHIVHVPQEVASYGDDVMRTQQRNNHHTPDTQATVTTASHIVHVPQEVASYGDDVVRTQRERVEGGDKVRAEVIATQNDMEVTAEIQDSITRYPLAVKMMFNYDVQSSAMAILRAMYRETVPARRFYWPVGVSDWEKDLMARTVQVPPHPNVVTMYSVFTAPVPRLRGAAALYPAALPARLHPDGAGRNMSLFLVMKRYDCSLAAYLSSGAPAPRTSLLLLAQLLEAVAHVNAAGVAHRDLKADNILLDLQEHAAPILVLTDFGCCLADRVNGMYLPYNSMEIDKGGNTALMAPEVITQQPGTFSSINYSRSDLWAVGCIAYELFGAPNPFYTTTPGSGGGRGAQVARLRSADYTEEDLPPLPHQVPPVVKALVANLLSRNPKKRLDPCVAATVCQLLLWAPSKWLRCSRRPPSAELLQWLLCLATKVLCEARAAAPPPAPRGRRSYPEYLLIASFLRRAKLAHVRAALAFIQQSW